MINKLMFRLNIVVILLIFVNILVQTRILRKYDSYWDVNNNNYYCYLVVSQPIGGKLSSFDVYCTDSWRTYGYMWDAQYVNCRTIEPTHPVSHLEWLDDLKLLYGDFFFLVRHLV